jgi:hypothetical protein
VNQETTASWEERLGDRLNALAESDAPAVTVTVHEVIASGRSHLRRRTRTFALSAALVSAVALAATLLAVAGPGHGSAPSGVTHSGTPSGSVTNPLSPSIAFGWLPSSLNGEYDVEGAATGPNYNEPVDPTTHSAPLNGPGVSAVVASAGVDGPHLTAYAGDPGSGMYTGGTKTPAGDVQGHQAWWTSVAPGQSPALPARTLELQWQYEPNAWASIVYVGQVDTAARTMVLKVANNLKIGRPTPLALPFSLPKLPADMHVDSALVNLPQPHGAQVGAASLRLCVESPCSPDTGGLVIAQQQNSSSFMPDSILAAFDAPLPDLQLPNGQITQSTPTTVDGQGAQVWTNTKGATVTFDYPGASVTISAADAEYHSLGGLSGFLAFCRSLSWYGSTLSHWTTNVIR